MSLTIIDNRRSLASDGALGSSTAADNRSLIVLNQLGG